MKPPDPTTWRASSFIDFSPYVGRPRAFDAELEHIREQLRRTLDGRIFEREGQAWYRRAYVEAFLFMYDTCFYDREAGRYRIDEILDDGEREFGGYDFIMLWQSYPRLGIDGRNQIDFYRDMPGGLPGLRALTERAHERGVRVFVSYNPWDIGTRREAGAVPSMDPRGYRYTFPEKGAPAMADAEALAALIEAIGADGVFLDTMAFDDPGFRAPLERANPHVVFNPEGVPPLDALHSITGSWLPHSALTPPKLSTIRWLEPRFSFRAIDRESLDRQAYIQEAFFHGCGLVVWENIFGWWNPWSSEERSLLRHCVRLLREYAEAFQDPDWQPYVATHVEGVYAHRWHSGDATVHTLLNASGGPVDAPVLTVPSVTKGGLELRHYDVWQGMEIQPEAHADSHRLALSLKPGEAGCVVSAPAGVAVAFPPALTTRPSAMEGTGIDRARVTLADLKLHAAAPSGPVADGEEPEGMCRVPGGLFRFVVRHNTSTVMEGACYGGIDHHLDKNHPPRYIELADYWMDKPEVTNAAYREFLAATYYMPRDPIHFLRHWQRVAGKFAEALEEKEQQLASNPLVLRMQAERRAKAEDPHRPPLLSLRTSSTIRMDCVSGRDAGIFSTGRCPPEEARWHWAHILSDELIRWRVLPYAFYPGPETGCYSGTVLVKEGIGRDGSRGITADAIEPRIEVDSGQASMFELNALRSPDREECTRNCFFHKRGFKYRKPFTDDVWAHKIMSSALSRTVRYERMISIDSFCSSIASDMLVRPSESASVLIDSD